MYAATCGRELASAREHAARCNLSESVRHASLGLGSEHGWSTRDISRSNVAHARDESFFQNELELDQV